MEPFLTSTAIVTLAEIGDKTQLLAIVLAARFVQPFPIVGGILVATLANHFLAALVGAQAAAFLQGDLFRYAIALSFIAMAAWTLVPDKLDEDEPLKAPAKMGAFLTTTAAFFIVEMGDKTQLATVALGARFESALIVTLGTTLGMMLANVPAVFLGHEILKRVSLTLVRRIAAGLFLVIGVWMIVQTAGWV
ncbi:TMEM165/GDT1 family protein [Phenylobacterium sp.]|uniref:TMEM165/GDT1 family protein n=1 Tax=Phenylobacterium sp. TaxID=1871053 RepID=UPI0025E9B96D|nr:TMEM165/GDT1 family protein [Phenylobacterium sp.]MCA6224896.1 TMEM165/GDT1 family protein [Phenylobacterium sp.]MCA6266894.1 TMEM165/GDT1 family protein [Phenylobacterium sp.]MCA6269406.1 TMEM165/GDT1 family protein [Phenylobacterium sp.]MCA6317332.1 TMEM165/GDT1 family protein [Phenylobacterium sp.]